MSHEADQPTGRRLAGRWWFAWIMITLLAGVTPYLHHRWKVAEIIEPLRGPWGLLPAHWLVLRHFGELSGYLLMVVLAVGLIAWRKPSSGRLAIALAGAATLIFSVAYASYCGLLITGFIASETGQIEVERRKAAAKKDQTESTPSPSHTDGKAPRLSSRPTARPLPALP